METEGDRGQWLRKNFSSKAVHLIASLFQWKMRSDEIWKYFIECMRSGQVIEGEKNACSKCRQKPLYKKPHCFRIVIEDYAFN